MYNQFGQPQPQPQQHPVYQNQPQSQPFNGERRFQTDRPASSNEDQMRKAYLQHMQVIEQHKAVEAHQRLMAQQRNDMMRQPQQQQYPRQGQMGQQPQRYMINGSVFSSAAPSARNSPPLQPMRPMSGMMSGNVSGFVTPGGGYGPMAPPRDFYPGPAPAPQPGPQMMSFMPAPQGPPVFDPVRGTFGPPAVYSMPASVPRTPFHEPSSPPGFMPPRMPQLPYGVSASVPRTPFNEPRTPFEPRSPAAEPVAYGEHFPMSRPVNNFPPQHSVPAPPPPRPQPGGYTSRDFGMPPQGNNFPPHHQQAPVHRHAPPPPAQAQRAAPPPPPQNNYAPPQQQQQLQHYAPPQQQYQPQQHMMSPYRGSMDISQKPPTISTNHIPPPKEDVVMTPNGSLNRVMADTERQIPTVTVPPASASRYDPDEAETRVRNLIADTERMLAGLSGFSSGRNQTNGVSV